MRTFIISLVCLVFCLVLNACGGSSIQPLQQSAGMGGMYGQQYGGMGGMPGMNGMYGSAGMPPVGVPGGMMGTAGAMAPSIAGLPSHAGTGFDPYLHQQIAAQWQARRAMFTEQAAATAAGAPVVSVGNESAESSGGSSADSEALDATMTEVGRVGIQVNNHEGRLQRLETPRTSRPARRVP